MQKDWRKRSKRGYFVSTTPEYKPLLKDESVQKWISNLKKKAGWRTTIPNFLRTLQKFTEYSRKNPNELITIASSTEEIDQREEMTSATSSIMKLVQEFINELLSSGKQEKARHVRTCLMSFFRANGISLELDAIPRVTKREEIILTKKQIYTMADYAGSPRNRAIILSMYQSGLGITALRNLKIGHIQEQLEKGKIPIKVRITSHINKKSSQMPFYAFFGVETCDALRAYVDERKRKIQRIMKKGGNVKELTESSPLFASEGKNVPFGDRMAVSSIWRVIKDSAERAGLQRDKIQPNSLKDAFEVELNRSVTGAEVRKYLMGSPIHGKKLNVADIEQKYLTCNFNRQELGKLIIIKEFLRSLGIEELETKIQKVRERNPQLTEMEAIRFIVRKDYVSYSAELKDGFVRTCL